ncbi:TIP41-like protein [Ischnura elegans]|uniref:TIP41-like protein n=1 Tax=Ischnura elegans TaxID=197161 RepID=UPI001ED8B2A1|nr:TIP41-like protein [Ischnura elegans]
MTETEQTSADIKKFPVNREEHAFPPWTVSYEQSHILHSKCPKEGGCDPNDETNLCAFCTYSKKVHLPQLPDMVFPKNILRIRNSNGCELNFNPLDALVLVKDGPMNIEIACAGAWKESRQDSGYLGRMIKPFDWTFTTEYKGTLLGNWKVEETCERIDVEKLKEKKSILFYHDLTLFEDELHDNGCAVCSVKIRVMPSEFFILLRFFLRIDNVLIRMNDTRIYHDFETNYLLREFTSKQGMVQDLKVPPYVLTDPNIVSTHLSSVTASYEKISFP